MSHRTFSGTCLPGGRAPLSAGWQATVPEGPEFHLNEAFSFYLRVYGQDGVDQYWELLTADGGQPGPCGWCTDKFGVSWQVIPRKLEELSGDYTTAANQRVCQAMLKMGKIDVAELQAAYAGA